MRAKGLPIGRPQAVEDVVVTALIPAAVVTLPGSEAAPPSGAPAQLAVVPFDLGENSAAPACETIAAGPAVRYELLVDGGELTVGALLRAAQEDRLGIGSPACVHLIERFLMEGEPAPSQSQRMRVSLTAKAWDPCPGGEPRDELPFLFDCTRHWYSRRRSGKPTRYWTVCHRGCASGAYSCSVDGRSGGACSGWRFCWC